MYAVAEAPFIDPTLGDPITSDRNKEWLRRELDDIWARHFHDVERANYVEIGFGRAWKARLGLITLSSSGRTTFIGVNSLLRSRFVPRYVPRVTIAHELVHYAHGFGSPLPKIYSHPHRGGVVAKELARRGLGFEHQLYNQWLQEHWHGFYNSWRRGRVSVEL